MLRKDGGRRASRGRTAGGEVRGSEDRMVFAFPFLQGLPKLACLAKALAAKRTCVVGGDGFRLGIREQGREG